MYVCGFRLRTVYNKLACATSEDIKSLAKYARTPDAGFCNLENCVSVLHP